MLFLGVGQGGCGVLRVMVKEVRDFRVGIHLQSFSAKACGTADTRKMWLNTGLEVSRVGVLCCWVDVHIRVRKSCSAQRDYR